MVLVATVGLGAAAVLARGPFEAPPAGGVAAVQPLEPRALGIGSMPRIAEHGDPEGAAAPTPQDPGPAAARFARSASAPTSEPDAQIEEELRWTELALEASRRISEPAPAARRPSASREALARAASGASAAALGCGTVGRACLSGSECCPGTVCAGGVAGYGTEGRCEAPR